MKLYIPPFVLALYLFVDERVTRTLVT